MNNRHPILSLGNLIEAGLGIIAIGSAIWSLMTFGLAPTLILSLLYTIAVTVIAALSAYHLFFAGSAS